MYHQVAVPNCATLILFCSEPSGSEALGAVRTTSFAVPAGSPRHGRCRGFERASAILLANIRLLGTFRPD